MKCVCVCFINESMNRSSEVCRCLVLCCVNKKANSNKLKRKRDENMIRLRWEEKEKQERNHKLFAYVCDNVRINE